MEAKCAPYIMLPYNNFLPSISIRVGLLIRGGVWTSLIVRGRDYCIYLNRILFPLRSQIQWNRTGADVISYNAGISACETQPPTSILSYSNSIKLLLWVVGVTSLAVVAVAVDTTRI